MFVFVFVFACLCLSKKTCWKVVPSGGKFLVANFSGSRLKLFRESAALLTLRQSSITLLNQKCHRWNDFHSSFSSSRSSWQTSGKVYSSPFGSLACYRRFFYSHQAQNLFHYLHHYWKSSLQFEYLVVLMISTSLILYVIFFPRTLGSLSNYNTRSKGHHLHLWDLNKKVSNSHLRPNSDNQESQQMSAFLCRSSVAKRWSQPKRSRVSGQLKWTRQVPFSCGPSLDLSHFLYHPWAFQLVLVIFAIPKLVVLRMKKRPLGDRCSVEFL